MKFTESMWLWKSFRYCQKLVTSLIFLIQPSISCNKINFIQITKPDSKKNWNFYVNSFLMILNEIHTKLPISIHFITAYRKLKEFIILKNHFAHLSFCFWQRCKENFNWLFVLWRNWVVKNCCYFYKITWKTNRNFQFFSWRCSK